MSSHKGTDGRFFQGLFIAIAMIVAVVLVVDGLRGMIPTNQIVKVRGFAEKPFTSDLARWSVLLRVVRPTLPAASQKLQSDTDEVLKYLKDNGIETRDISVKAAYPGTINEINDKGYTTNDVIAHTLERYIEIASADVKRIETLSSDISRLLEQDIDVRSQAPAYYYTKVDDVKMELLEEAAKDAYERAKILAASSGSKLGSLRAARQGKFQILAAHATEDSGDYYDTTSIEKKMTAAITVDYSID